MEQEDQTTPLSSAEELRDFVTRHWDKLPIPDPPLFSGREQDPAFVSAYLHGKSYRSVNPEAQIEDHRYILVNLALSPRLYYLGAFLLKTANSAVLFQKGMRRVFWDVDECYTLNEVEGLIEHLPHDQSLELRRIHEFLDKFDST